MPKSFHKHLKENADKMGLKGEERRKYIYGGLEKDTKKLAEGRRAKMARATKERPKYPEYADKTGKGKKKT
jgi:hypothetical protein